MFVVPIVTAVLVSRQVGNAIDRDAGEVRWWVILIAATATTLVIADRVARRLLPLASLLRLSLEFPGRAPNRLALALPGRLLSTLNRHDRLTRGHSERLTGGATFVAGLAATVFALAVVIGAGTAEDPLDGAAIGSAIDETAAAVVWVVEDQEGSESDPVVSGTDQAGDEITTSVTVEKPLTLFLNGQEIVTMMTTLC